MDTTRKPCYKVLREICLRNLDYNFETLMQQAVDSTQAQSQHGAEYQKHYRSYIIQLAAKSRTL